jgi:uncharacterized membrane protein
VIATPALVCACLAATLGGGAALKGVCFGGHTDNWRSRLCYNDIQPLYHSRGIDHGVFPYIHATLTGTQGRHGFNEYPVLTGIFMWATGLPAQSGSSYLVITMVLLSVCAVAVTWLLWTMVEVRAVYWAASPILALYAFHNWDILAITAAVVGIYQWRRGRPLLAAVAFAVGAAFKLYPALFIVPLVFDEIAGRRSAKAVEVGGVGFGALALINLPFILANASGWWATYRFHADRAPTTSGTVWSVIDPALSTTAENLLSFLALASALVIITIALVAVAQDGRYRVVEWCAAATAAFILLNKVSSPQYILWLVPFLALLRVRAFWSWLLSAIAVVRYGALFGVNVLPLGLRTADRIVHTAVLMQALLLAAFIVTVLVRRIPSELDPQVKLPAPSPARLPGRPSPPRPASWNESRANHWALLAARMSGSMRERGGSPA